MNKNFNLKSLQASYILDLIPVDDLSNLAVTALSNNVESESLIKLAGLSKEDTEKARMLFESALIEFDQPDMSKTDALKIYTRTISELIIESKVNPFDGAKSIWRARVNSGVEGLHDLDSFIYAASEIEDRPEDKIFFEKEIIDEAKRWITK